MRVGMLLLLMVSPLVLAESVGRLEGKSGTGKVFRLPMESVGVARMPTGSDSGIESLYAFTGQPCIFLQGTAMTLVCRAQPEADLSGTIYEQAGKADPQTGEVLMECTQGCSQRVPAVMRFIPVKC